MIKIKNFKLPKCKSYKIETPEFTKYKPDINKIIRAAQTYKKFKNLIVIGYGGSINSFKAFYFANKDKAKKKVFIINTVEPEVLNRTAKECNKKDTIIVAISKSGNTVSLIEDVLFFMNKNFKNFLFVTSGGALEKIASKMDITIIKHPDIGGRFAGITECALVPLAIAGINIKKIVNGARKVYDNKQLNSKIICLASSFWQLEKEGYTEIFAPDYSEFLDGVNLLATQLIHETTGKDGKGQTILTALSPESQHETNQRFFGGRKNMIGLFTTIKEHKKATLNVPKVLEEVKIKKDSIKILNNLELNKSLNYEALGVIATAKRFKIPHVVLEIEKLDEENTAELVGFWQLFAVYSAMARKQNPYNQPEVEHSKILTLKLIKGKN